MHHGRLAQLDGLRALAVLAVIYHHHGLVRWPSRIPTPGGIGVHLFFVVSGFLITKILLNARRQVEARGGSCWAAWRGFYARRALRIFPAYYVLLIGMTWLASPMVRDLFWWHAGYLSNYYIASHSAWIGAATHFWSLAVEEQFYLCWPLLVLFLPLSTLPRLFGATLVVGMASRCALMLVTGNAITAQVPLLSCVDSLGMGALLAWRWTVRSEPVSARVLWTGVALAFILAVTPRSLVNMVLMNFACGLIFVWLVDRAARGRLCAWLALRPLVYIGTISYGVYLVHNFTPHIVGRLMSVMDLGTAFPSRLGGLRFAAVTAGSIGLAALSWHGLEKPINDLKRFFPYVPAEKTRFAKWTSRSASPRYSA